METKFKLSDIIKYMLLGAIALVVIYGCVAAILAPGGFMWIINFASKHTSEISSFTFIIAATFVSASYIAGILINAHINI